MNGQRRSYQCMYLRCLLQRLLFLVGKHPCGSSVNEKCIQYTICKGRLALLEVDLIKLFGADNCIMIMAEHKNTVHLIFEHYIQNDNCNHHLGSRNTKETKFKLSRPHIHIRIATSANEIHAASNTKIATTRN